MSALDPELFSTIEELVDEALSGHRSARYSPLEVARWLEGFAGAAARHLVRMETSMPDRTDPSFRRWKVDVAIQIALGRFFAEKLRAGVRYEVYARTGNVHALRHGISAYRAARAAWMEAVHSATGVYVGDLTFGPEPWLRGHWSDRLAAVDQDIADIEAELSEPMATDHSHEEVPTRAFDEDEWGRPTIRVEHVHLIRSAAATRSWLS